MPQKVKEQRLVDEENNKQRMLRQQAMNYEKTKVFLKGDRLVQNYTFYSQTGACCNSDFL